MNSSLSLPFLFPFLSLLLSFSLSSTPPDFRFYSCNNIIGNYSTTGTFASNLNTLLSAITSDTGGDKKFFSQTAGGGNSGVDQVNGIALCRGDVTSLVCQSCLSNATQKIRAVCPIQKEAVGWYNECMLRYSNATIIGTVDTSPPFAIFNTRNASDPVVFNKQLGSLLRKLLSEAMAGDSRLKFADGGPARVSDFMSVYAYVECTPDLTGLDCSNCINGLINYIPSCCDSKIGALIANPSCNIRYDINQFYNSNNDPLSPPSPAPTPNATSITGNGNSKGGKVTIAIVVPIVVCIVLVAVVFTCCFFRRRRWKKLESPASSSIHKNEDDITSIESLRFDFSTIREATDNFSDANKLGRGGFGVVYKGKLSNGQQIAVKRLAKNSSQGEHEFKNEVLLVAKLQHRNLVRLFGFCLEGDERLLIYELLPNSSLDHFLFDSIKRPQLNWKMRYKIITGIARGMLYLHEDSQLRIIHRDLKASNILLDAEMNAKISDFGMARLFQVDQTHGDTNRIVGTYGYMAPEYALHGFFSAKSDVYSFGVLVLEMISGRKSVGFHQGENSEDLISWVWRNWRDGTPMNIIDESISANSSRTEILRWIHIALLSVQEEPMDRPTMSSIVLMLSSQTFTLPMPTHPAFVTRTFINPLNTLSEEHSSLGTMSNNSKSKSLQKSVYEDSDSELLPR